MFLKRILTSLPKNKGVIFLWLFLVISVSTSAMVNTDSLYYKGMENLQERNYEIAIKNFKKCVELTNHPNATYQLGKAYLFAGKNLDKAVKIYKKYIKDFRNYGNKYKIPTINGAYWRLGLVYERKGELNKARKVYHKALQYDDLNSYVIKALENLGNNIDIILASKQTKYISQAEAKTDLNFFLTALEKTHPNPYAYTDKNSMRRKFQTIKSSISDSISILEFAKIVAQYAAELGDGHTYVNLPFRRYYNELPEDALLFPYDVTIQNGKATIKNVFNEDEKLFLGYEILSINKKNIDSILKEALKYQSGEKISFKYQKVAKRFRKILYLLYKWKGNFIIKLRNNENGQVITKNIPGIKKGIIAEYLKEKEVQHKTPFKFDYLSDINTGLIDYRSFSQMDNFRIFLDSTFTFIQNRDIDNLIIDIRNNGGGNSKNGNLFLSYLTQKPYIMFAGAQVKLSKKVKNRYKLNIPKWIQIFPLYYLHKDVKMLYTKPDGFVRETKNEPYVHKVSEKLFDGNIFVLIGSSTFSSAADFAAVIKDFEIGTLIGEETGGLGSCYGDIISFKMPCSELNFGVSHKYFLRAGGFDDGRGVIPDYNIQQTSDDIAKGVDTVLEFTKELIRKNQTEQ